MFKNMLFPRVAKYVDTDGVVTYTDPTIAGKAMKGDVEYEYDTGGKIYADGDPIGSQKKLIGGTVKVGVTRITPQARALIGGHTFNAATTGQTPTPAQVLVKVGDEPNEVGFGFVTIENDEAKAEHFYANIFPRLMFTTPKASYKTAEKQTSYQTPELESEMMKPVSGVLEDRTEHASAAAALEYIEDFLGFA
jgi:hypothetical protein